MTKLERTLAIALLTLGIFVVADFIASYAIYDENVQLKEQVAKQSNLQERFDNILAELHRQNGRVLELESANEALIKVLSTEQKNKAIKNTPLPKLKGC